MLPLLIFAGTLLGGALAGGGIGAMAGNSVERAIAKKEAKKANEKANKLIEDGNYEALWVEFCKRRPEFKDVPISKKSIFLEIAPRMERLDREILSGKSKEEIIDDVENELIAFLNNTLDKN